MCISFQSKYIDNTGVQKYNFASKQYEKLDTSFVELQVDSADDKLALNNAVEMWEDSSGFANCIKDRFNHHEYFSEKTNFYAITTQKDSFENLNPHAILGLAELTPLEDNNEVYIDYLVVAPDKKSFEPYSTYQKIGTAILDMIKKISKGKDILLRTTASAENFYYRNGFERKLKELPDLLLYKA